MRELSLEKMSEVEGGSFGPEVNAECGMYALGWVD